MTSNELAASGRALYGENWQAAFARDLNVSDRTLRRWLSEGTAIPVGVQSDIHRLLLSRIEMIGGMIGYSVNQSDRSVFHYPTSAYFQFDENGSLNLIFDKLVPAGQRELVIAGALEAVRRERERDPRVNGRFVWAG